MKHKAVITQTPKGDYVLTCACGYKSRPGTWESIKKEFKNHASTN